MSFPAELLFAIALAVSVLLGYLVTSLLWPPEVARMLTWAFAPGIGAGLCSIILVVFRRAMFTIELGLLLVLAAVWLFVGRSRFVLKSSSAIQRLPASCLLLIFALGMAVSTWMVRIERTPYGDWDATGIWNSHARYLYRDGPAWQKRILNTFHADYPLLVPSSAARLDRYLGEEIPDAVGGLGMIFSLSAVAVLLAALAELRGLRLAALFTLVLLGTPFFIEYGVSQSADVPLSLYILSTFALILLNSKRNPDKPGLLVLAGFTAGCAGWTKNEGLLFIAVTCVVLLMPAVVRPKETLGRFSAFMAGLILPLSVIVWFKLAIAPQNDIVQNRHYAEMIQKVLSPDRYAIVIDHAARAFWSFGNWIVNPILLLLLFIALHGVDRGILRDRGWIEGCFILTAVMTGYFFIYVITPMDLQWHLDSSLPRLLLQLWPATLLLAGMITSPPESSI